MQIDTIIPATQIVSGYGCTIDGVDYTASCGPDWSVTRDSEAAFASCSVPVLVPFSLSSGRHTIALYSGWQYDTSQPVFVGEVTNQSDTFYPRRATLQAGGYLRRLEAGLDVAKAFYYDGGTAAETAALLLLIPLFAQAVPISTDAALIVHILETYGITPATSGHSIEASWWIPAKLEPIVWDVGQSGWSIIQEIDRIADYRTADGRLGQVLRRRLYGQVPSGVRHTFQQGIDILDLQASTAFEVYNQVKVLGALDPSLAVSDPDNAQVVGIAPTGAPVPSSYIPSPPGVRTDTEISSNYIETFVDADAIAARRLTRLQEPLQAMTLMTFGCPELDIGDGIGIVATALGISTTGFVVAHTISGQPLRSQLSIRASVPDGGTGVRPNQPPLVQMLISVLLEHVLIAGVVTPLAMITVDARGSTDPDGAIVSWTITIDGVAYTGLTIATAIITHATTAASPVPVIVSCTDDLGLVGSLTQQATWDPATTLTEPLTLAELTQVEATNNGEQTWQAFVAPVTAVAPIALGGSILAGCSDGSLYRSIDMLATAPTLVATLPAAVNCIWSNERIPDRWLVGLTNGDVWLSIDDGITWTKQATLAGSINDISESPYQVNQATAAVGNGIWTTWDLRTWTLLYDSVSSALRFAAGLYEGVSTIYSSHANGQIIRYRDTPASILVVGLLPTGAARGLTLAIAEELLYCLSDTATGTTYRMTPAGVFTAGPDLGTACNHAIRSGAGDWVYAACDGALRKWLPRQDVAYDVRIMTSPQRALAVGYGSARVPVIPAVGIELLIPTRNTTPGGLWRYRDGSWTLHAGGVGGLPSGWTWTVVAADPANRDRLLMWGYTTYIYANAGAMKDQGTGLSPLWSSTNGGVTWSAVSLPIPTNYIGDDSQVRPETPIIRFASDGSLLLFAQVAGIGNFFGAPDPGLALWRGPLGAVTVIGAIDGNRPLFGDTTGVSRAGLAALPDGAAALGANWGSRTGAAGEQIAYLTAAASGITAYRGTGNGELDVIDGLAVVARVGANLYYSANLATTNTALAIAGGAAPSNGAQASVVASKDQVFTNTSTGILRVTSIASGPASSTVSAAVVWTLTRARQAGATAIAGRMTHNDVSNGGEQAQFAVYDGATWATIAGPAAADARNINLAILALEVIG